MTEFPAAWPGSIHAIIIVTILVEGRFLVDCIDDPDAPEPQARALCPTLSRIQFVVAKQALSYE
jgi:hypothetical protein